VGVSGEPDRFPADLLTQPAGARQEYFEQQCLIEHPHLRDALEQIVQTICPPGEGARRRRPGTMVLVIGPSRVGKTTLIRFGNCAQCSNENTGLRAIVSNIERKFFALNVRHHFHCPASFHATGHFAKEKR